MRDQKHTTSFAFPDANQRIYSSETPIAPTQSHHSSCHSNHNHNHHQPHLLSSDCNLPMLADPSSSLTSFQIPNALLTAEQRLQKLQLRKKQLLNSSSSSPSSFPSSFNQPDDRVPIHQQAQNTLVSQTKRHLNSFPTQTQSRPSTTHLHTISSPSSTSVTNHLLAFPLQHEQPQPQRTVCTNYTLTTTTKTAIMPSVSSPSSRSSSSSSSSSSSFSSPLLCNSNHIVGSSFNCDSSQTPGSQSITTQNDFSAQTRSTANSAPNNCPPSPCAEPHLAHSQCPTEKETIVITNICPSQSTLNSNNFVQTKPKIDLQTRSLPPIPHSSTSTFSSSNPITSAFVTEYCLPTPSEATRPEVIVQTLADHPTESLSAQPSIASTSLTSSAALKPLKVFSSNEIAKEASTGTSGADADDEHDYILKPRKLHRHPPNHFHQYHHLYHYQKRRPRPRTPYRSNSYSRFDQSSSYCARLDSLSDHSSELENCRRSTSRPSFLYRPVSRLQLNTPIVSTTTPQPSNYPVVCRAESIQVIKTISNSPSSLFQSKVQKCTNQIKSCLLKITPRKFGKTNRLNDLPSPNVTLKTQLDALPVHRIGAGFFVTLHILFRLLRDFILCDSCSAKSSSKMENANQNNQNNPTNDLNVECANEEDEVSPNNKWSMWQTRGQHLIQCAKKFVAYLFSTSGLCLLTVGYCIMGAAIFERLERAHNLNEIRSMFNYRNETVYRLWTLTKSSNVLKEDEWTSTASNFLERFEKEIIKKVETEGYSGNITDKWDFSDSLLYSITVITTIGYGHLSPKTMWGRFVTILYAIFGIPIMLLCITNLGHIMANTFRFGYQSVCCYPCNRLERRAQRHQLKMIQREINDRSNSQSIANRLAVASNRRSGSFSINSAANSPSVLENVYQEVGNRSPNITLSTPNQHHETRASQSIHYEANELIVRLKDNQLVIEKATPDIEKHHRVPIRLVLLIVIAYLCLGGLLFTAWESEVKSEFDHNEFFRWTYFCFITLSTIGFGDIVPGNSIRLQQNQEGTTQILFCCLYLVFGLALIAMSFNLVQEEVIFKMKRLCRQFGVYFQKG